MDCGDSAAEVHEDLHADCYQTALGSERSENIICMYRIAMTKNFTPGVNGQCSCLATYQDMQLQHFYRCQEDLSGSSI